MLPLLVILIVGLPAFALLLRFGPEVRRKPVKILASAMAAINVAGTAGLGWFVIEILTHDGVVMIAELSTCAGLMALLLLLTGAGLELSRRGKTGASTALLAVGALPTIFVYGFLAYLFLNPIDWR
jgi:hypothetical protein